MELTLESTSEKSESLNKVAPWSMMPLNEALVDIQPGFACGRKVTKGGIVHLRMDNIGIDGQLDTTRITYVDFDIAKAAKYLLRPGDVLFNNTNSKELVGKSVLFALSDRDYYYSNHLTRLRVRPDVLTPEWLVLCLRKLWLDEYFQRICTQWVSQSAVPQRKLKVIGIPVPLKEEQVRIVTKVEAIEGRVRQVSLLQDEARQQIEALASSLLQKAMVGDL
jgi:type I restriction enzyme S subunit